jgi:general L-amino acid transport system substrate-binding protein
MRRAIPRVTIVAALVLVAASCTREAPQGETGGEEGQAQATLLQEIQERGILRCGVNNTVPGFGFEEQGEIVGFDIDFCKAMAAAIFGTPDPQEGENYELIPVDADFRFSALRNGRFDVLVRNTTWTSSRDGAEGVQFAHPNFYDSQGMVAPSAEVSRIEDLDGATICVTTGTTTELNLADYFGARNLDFDPLALEDYEVIFEAFRQDRCDAVTGDRSALLGLQEGWEEEIGNLTLLPDIMSKEPLAPAVLETETDLHNVVDWVVNGLILAEELGVTSDNVQRYAENPPPPEPQIGALLGTPIKEAQEVGVTFEWGLEVEDNFMVPAIQAVGNYGEIFDRHLTPLGHERGLNALWTDGGIQYAMPFR